MKDYRVYLAQILERIGRVEEFTKDGKETFLKIDSFRMGSQETLKS